jgi:predicted Zn-dependent protease
LNAFASSSTNTIVIGLGLAELIADSPSELAHLIGHELGHLYQALHGLTLHPNAELDADIFGFIATLIAGYDPYGGAGWLGKAMMLTRTTNPIIQIFENISSPHTSFSYRMENLLDAMELACSHPDVASFCQQYREIFHPHVPGPLRKPPDENQTD